MPIATVSNKHIAKLLRELADLTALNEENKFASNAYKRAADEIEVYGGDLSETDPSTLPGVGNRIASKVGEIIETGTCDKLKKLRRKHGKLLGLLSVPGIGPATARKLHTQFGVTTVDEVCALVEDGKIKSKRIVDSIRNNITDKRISYWEAKSKADFVMIRLAETIPHNFDVEPCGSLRRHEETIGDLDLIVVGAEIADIVEASKETLDSIVETGRNKVSGTVGHIHIDIRLAHEDNHGAMLLYFTGDKGFNIGMRSMAMKRGWTLNEYGLWNGSEWLAGRTEKEIFDKLEIDYVDPEERHKK